LTTYREDFSTTYCRR